MNEIEQLRKDIEKLADAQRIINGISGEVVGEIIRTQETLERKIAKLEAEAAAATDPHKHAKELVYVPWLDETAQKKLSDYARHLEQRVAELEQELRCERIDGGKVHADLKARIAELEAELARRPVVHVLRRKKTGKVETWWSHGVGELPVFYLPCEVAWRRENVREELDDYTFEPYTGEQA